MNDFDLEKCWFVVARHNSITTDTIILLLRIDRYKLLSKTNEFLKLN